MKKISIEYFIVISEIITDTDVDHVMKQHQFLLERLNTTVFIDIK